MPTSSLIASDTSLAQLKGQIAGCQRCAGMLPHEPRPVFQLDEKATLLIAGQAPGRRVHETGIPFNDPSGDRLREWMSIDRATFYDARRVAILPMGLCYPGTVKGSDLPPRPECAGQWRQAVLERLPKLQLILAIGQYAQRWHLPAQPKGNLTRRVQMWQAYGPGLMPLPHPSPRNNGWLARNPWFAEQLLPELRDRVARCLASDPC